MPTASATTRLTAFHLLLVVTALTVVFGAVASFEGDVAWWAVALAIGELTLVVRWATGRVLTRHAEGERSSLDGFLGSGVRWGAIAGVALWTALLATWVVLGLGAVLFSLRDETTEDNLVGGEYAFVWLSVLALVPGALIAASTGAAIGGVIGIIDRMLVVIGQSRFRRPERD